MAQPQAPRPFPRLIGSVYVPVKPDPEGFLNEASIRNARWNLVTGCTVRISIYGMRGYSSSAPGVLGRILVEGGAAEVEISASAKPALIADFRQAVQDAMVAYASVMAAAGQWNAEERP